MGCLPENAWAERGARIETQPRIADSFEVTAPKGELGSPSGPVRAPRLAAHADPRRRRAGQKIKLGWLDHQWFSPAEASPEDASAGRSRRWPVSSSKSLRRPESWKAHLAFITSDPNSSRWSDNRAGRTRRVRGPKAQLLGKSRVSVMRERRPWLQSGVVQGERHAPTPRGFLGGRQGHAAPTPGGLPDYSLDLSLPCSGLR